VAGIPITYKLYYYCLIGWLLLKLSYWLSVYYYYGVCHFIFFYLCPSFMPTAFSTPTLKRYTDFFYPNSMSCSFLIIIVRISSFLVLKYKKSTALRPFCVSTRDWRPDSTTWLSGHKQYDSSCHKFFSFISFLKTIVNKIFYAQSKNL